MNNMRMKFRGLKCGYVDKEKNISTGEENKEVFEKLKLKKTLLSEN